MVSRPFFAAVIVSLLCPLTAHAQVSNVTVSTGNVTAADEWATRAFQDPLDMDQLTDLGYYVFSQDGPGPGLSNVQFGNGVFSATTANASPNFYVLETGNPVSAKLGKTGDNFSIDANTYRMFAMRMCLAGPGLNTLGQPPTNPNSAMVWAWWTANAYESPINVLGSFSNFGGCHIYLVNLTNVFVAQGSAWGGTVRALRLLPTFIAGVQMEIDWIRIAATTGAQNVTVSWTGGAADVYLDNDADPGNGNLGAIVKDNQTSKGVTSGFVFQGSALAPGSYRALVCPAGSTSGCNYSGAFTVNAIPTLAMTSPSDEGSSDDFATVQLNNGWDMNALTDIDRHHNVATLSVDPAFDAQNAAGASLGPVRVLRGRPAATNPGDAYLYTLSAFGTGRGISKQIDSDRYRILTFEMGYPGPRDVNLGSIARIVWKATAETNENVSQDILISHRAGANVLDKVTLDMETLLRETDPGLGVLGWTGLIEQFRIDPHEFDARYSPSPVEFWIRRIKLAALDTIGASNQFTFTWTYTDPVNTSAATNARVTLNFDPDRNPNNGNHTAIPGCSNVVATSGACSLSGVVAAGTYYVYATFSDGVNANSTHSRWPVVVDPSFVPKPRVVLDRSILNFGGTANGRLTTPPQQVRLSIAGTGSVTWSVVKSGGSSHFFDVTPASGTGPATLTVSIPPGLSLPNNLVGELGTLSVVSSNADNTPQSVRVFLRMTPAGANPVGAFDTPIADSVLSGSVAVTGWVLDDIGVSAVAIQRDPHPGDPAGAVVNGRVFVGNATLVEGARSDIEALFPNTPANYQAGWGYLMLTRGLIWEGQGPFNLYAVATDLDGHAVVLGSKRVSVNNSNANRPFGAIDTPGQGATVGGQLPNTGWVLSPGTTVPPSGVQVAIDGVFLPGTFSMSNRDDITNGFGPMGFNTTNAGRGMFIDTTAYSDGVHTIGWFVTDALGRADGVGSRFFRIQNGASLTTASGASSTPSRFAGATTAFAHLGEKLSVLPVRDDDTQVRFGRGMIRNTALTRVEVGPFGTRDVRVREMERVELHVGRAEPNVRYAAYRTTGDRLHLLPYGASFDVARGVLYWQPGPGFVGDFDFVFVRTRNGTDEAQIPVRVVVGSSTAVLRASTLRAGGLFAGR